MKTVVTLNEQRIVLSAKVVEDNYMVKLDELDCSTDPIYQYSIPSVGWFWLEEADRLVPPRPSTKENWTWEDNSWRSNLVSPEGNPEILAEHVITSTPEFEAGPVRPTPGDN
jgi:hypothetical protein